MPRDFCKSTQKQTLKFIPTDLNRKKQNTL